MTCGSGTSGEPSASPNLAAGGQAKLLLTAFKGSAGGTSLMRGDPWASSWSPVAWSFCLIHEPDAPQLIDYTGSTPLPEAVQSNAVVGCNWFIPPGRQVVDFDETNTPGWQVFIDRLTNGVDEMIWSLPFIVDAAAIPIGTSGGGCPESCPSADWKTKLALSGKNPAPDLSGFVIDFVRLVVHDSSWSISPAPLDPAWPGQYYLNNECELVWEIYGHRAP
jgi:hypothetical protein